MNKQELVAHVAESANLTKVEASAAVDAVIEGITKSLTNGEGLTLVGFGKFDVKERAARKGRNPKTGEEFDLPATKVPHFKAGKGLKDAVAAK